MNLNFIVLRLSFTSGKLLIYGTHLTEPQTSETASFKICLKYLILNIVVQFLFQSLHDILSINLDLNIK